MPAYPRTLPNRIRRFIVITRTPRAVTCVATETHKNVTKPQGSSLCKQNCHVPHANIIWTDDSSVQLKRHCQTMRVKVGQEVPFKPVAKHALKIHVWAGISKRGATNICIFQQTMDAPLYVSILKGFLVLFIQKHFEGTNYRCMQDNDPKHTSRLAKAFYEEEGINWWPTPASSADFNPIEIVWRELKYFLAREAKPMTKRELVGGIKAFWSNAMTAAKCQRYIEHTPVVLPKIIDCEGGITGE